MGNVDNSKVLEKRERICNEIKNLNKLYSKIDKKTKKAVHSLIENAAFMTVSLEDLQNEMIENGMVCEYQNGENQWGTKDSPEAKLYNTMIRNHSTIMKQLTDLLPKPEKVVEDDGFNDFVNNK